MIVEEVTGAVYGYGPEDVMPRLISSLGSGNTGIAFVVQMPDPPTDGIPGTYGRWTVSMVAVS